MPRLSSIACQVTRLWCICADMQPSNRIYILHQLCGEFVCQLDWLLSCLHAGNLLSRRPVQGRCYIPHAVCCQISAQPFSHCNSCLSSVESYPVCLLPMHAFCMFSAISMAAWYRISSLSPVQLPHCLTRGWHAFNRQPGEGTDCIKHVACLSRLAWPSHKLSVACGLAGLGMVHPCLHAECIQAHMESKLCLCPDAVQASVPVAKPSSIFVHSAAPRRCTFLSRLMVLDILSTLLFICICIARPSSDCQCSGTGDTDQPTSMSVCLCVALLASLPACLEGGSATSSTPCTMLHLQTWPQTV